MYLLSRFINKIVSVCLYCYLSMYLNLSCEDILDS